MNQEAERSQCTNHDCYHHSLKASLTYRLPAYVMGVIAGFVVVQGAVALF